MTLKKGDVVQLKSSGPKEPKMTVADVSEDGVLCVWFDKSMVREKTFSAELLIKAERTAVQINIDLGDGPPKTID